MTGKTSKHILNTAANLLGFCLFVITSFHISNQAEAGFIDELTSLVAVMLTLSCLLSFFSIRAGNQRKARNLENIADKIFIAALSGILVIIVLIAFDFL